MLYQLLSGVEKVIQLWDQFVFWADFPWILPTQNSQLPNKKFNHPPSTATIWVKFSGRHAQHQPFPTEASIWGKISWPCNVFEKLRRWPKWSSVVRRWAVVGRWLGWVGGGIIKSQVSSVCMVYVPTYMLLFMINVGKYTIHLVFGNGTHFLGRKFKLMQNVW